MGRNDEDNDNSEADLDVDDLPDGPNWRLDAEDQFDFSDDSDSEDDVWPGLQAGVPAGAAAPPRMIEIINFAGAGAQNPRQIPMQVNNVGDAVNNPPPAAPAAPRRNNGRRGRRPGHRAPIEQRRQQQQGQQARARARPRQNLIRAVVAEAGQGPQVADLGAEIDAEEQQMERAAPAPGQAAMQPAPLRAMGLERFLELARHDQEDEWDSDELDEFEDNDVDEDDFPQNQRLLRLERARNNPVW